MDVRTIDLISPDEVIKSFNDVDGVQEYLEKRLNTANSPTSDKVDKVASDWLSWCRSQRKKVAVVERDVPANILPGAGTLKATLADIKVSGGKKRVPDDALYNQNPELRLKVARGNTVVIFRENGKILHDGVVFALRKFTGGMGDEDEDQPENNLVWKQYFLRPYEEVERVVCTGKANGEAAHLSVRYLTSGGQEEASANKGGGFVLFLGSKNVHMAVCRREDIEKYTESRYQVAKEVAVAVFDMLDTLAPAKVSLLLSLLHHLRLTAVFEVLQPSHQHVVNLSHLGDRSALQFIAFVAPYHPQAETTSYCDVTPETGFRICGHLGVPCVTHQVIPPKDVEARMEQVRQGYGHEGEVLYFVAGGDRVIGLLKKKTVWYVVLRAIREKVAYACAMYHKDGRTVESGKIESRLKAIQNWLGFSDASLDSWTDLGCKFQVWALERLKSGEAIEIRGKFPIHWKEFLDQTGKTDRIS